MFMGLEELDVTKFSSEELDSLNFKARLIFLSQKHRLSRKEEYQYKMYVDSLDPFNFCFSCIKEDFYKVDCWVLEYIDVDSIMNINNDEFGVLYFIDEFLTIFNSIKSKDMDLEDFEAICQLRKQHKRIVSCAQVFGRVAKGWREQVKEIICCKNFLGLIQYNVLIDGTDIDPNDSNKEPPIKQRFLWFHTKKLYESYDTYQVVRKNGVDFEDESYIQKNVKNKKDAIIKKECRSRSWSRNYR